ncbi:hypothetical protein P4310_18015 [Bacillus thuringiensis]|uniref:hypothetical protein n=1 Tax=Bacillus cereus group TaxID=86661 RepID=UPI000A35FF71|nr:MULTISPECIES: hypothetical protein [Bacillus cereus group]MEB9553111.1 hypothetical protein [Bacillus cereus]MEB9571417.1 hypothetical protein [Bacillus cereus]MED3067430.1 hypothetical protein [Bacillus thuringiensis]OUB30768.1 hypothetical protein BK737_17020 [Bacillus thuringiensis serovar palmanyolensis]OUB76777.1 hypothetical protein BK744_09645 [Bacillus thuringiensis serovar zhaodongensis]
MFNRTKEVPKYQQIHSGLYKFELPYITGLFKSMEANEDKVREVQRFPVEVYVLNDKDIANDIEARFVMFGNDTRSVGDRYAQLATILRRAYFTALFIPDVPEKIKWIEHRNAKNTVRNREEILEIELKWDEKSASYSIVGHSLLNSIFD